MMFLYSVQDKYMGGLSSYREDGLLEVSTRDLLITELKAKSEDIMMADGFFDTLNFPLTTDEIEKEFFNNIDCIFWYIKDDLSIDEIERIPELLNIEGLDYVVEKYAYPWCYELKDFI